MASTSRWRSAGRPPPSPTASRRCALAARSSWLGSAARTPRCRSRSGGSTVASCGSRGLRLQRDRVVPCSRRRAAEARSDADDLAPLRAGRDRRGVRTGTLRPAREAADRALAVARSSYPRPRTSLKSCRIGMTASILASQRAEGQVHGLHPGASRGRSGIASSSRAGAARRHSRRAGDVLLQLRGDFKIWGLPAGGMELDESVWDTLCREVHEETGLTVLRARRSRSTPTRRTASPTRTATSPAAHHGVPGRGVVRDADPRRRRDRWIFGSSRSTRCRRRSRSSGRIARRFAICSSFLADRRDHRRLTPTRQRLNRSGYGHFRPRHDRCVG